MLRCAAALGASEPVRIVPTLLALHALPPEYKDRRDDMSAMIADEADPARCRAKQARDQRRRLLRRHRASRRRRSSACSTAAQANGLRGPAPRRAACRTRTAPRSRRKLQGAVRRPSRASRRGRREGDGRGRHRRRAAARRLLRAAGKDEAAGRAAAQAQGADRHRDRLQSRHLADAVADAGDEHGVHLVRPDAGGGACRA